MECFFEGLGTEVISVIIGLFLGAGAGGIAGIVSAALFIPVKQRETWTCFVCPSGFMLITRIL